MPYTIEHFFAGEAPDLGSGTRAVDWIYVDDVVEAFLCAATDRRAAGLVADIGTGSTHTIGEVVAALAELTGWARPVRFGDRSDRRHDEALVADPEPARETLGWTARTELGDGLARTVSWHRERGNLSPAVSASPAVRPDPAKASAVRSPVVPTAPGQAPGPG